VPEHAIQANQINEGIDVISFLSETGIFSSKGEARKMLLGGGISINKEKVADPAHMINQASLLCEKYIVVQKGKKNHFLVKKAG
jgi:tyrosyl-tRNA synthetase